MMSKIVQAEAALKANLEALDGWFIGAAFRLGMFFATI